MWPITQCEPALAHMWLADLGRVSVPVGGTRASFGPLSNRGVGPSNAIILHDPSEPDGWMLLDLGRSRAETLSLLGVFLAVCTTVKLSESITQHKSPSSL